MIYFVRFLSSAAWSCFYPFMAIWLNSAVGLSTSAAGIVVGFAIDQQFIEVGRTFGFRVH